MHSQDEVILEYYPDKGNSGDCLVLTPHLLEIDYKHTHYQIALAHLQNIELKHVRLMLYYLLGAFTVVLTLLAIGNRMLAPLPGILLLLIGSASFYIGWKGKMSLALSTLTHDYVFWFNGPYIPFREFVNTVRHRLITEPLAAFPDLPPESS